MLDQFLHHLPGLCQIQRALPTAREAPTAAGDDFDLVTWLVIMDHWDQSTKGDR